MSDELTHPTADAAAFDDDRLLASALGLDDDPELAAAAAVDTGLRRRLDAVRAEVDEIGAQVHAAVPSPAEDYADPGDARWAGLQRYFAPAAPAAERGRTARWLRVLAPAAAALIAVAVGLALVNNQKSGTASFSESLPTASKATAGAAAPETGAGQDSATRTADHIRALRDQIDTYAVVVLAEAKAASGAFQRFVVVRMLKGAGPDVIRLHVADRPADEGRFHLVFLHPLLGGAAAPSEPPTPAPGPTAAGSVLAQLASGEPVTYSYQGETAVLRELPVGIDPSTIQLP